MFEELKKILIEELDVDEAVIKPEAQLATDLGVNSLELSDLVLICEERYNVNISDDDIRSFVTVEDVVTYLDKNAK